MSENVLDEQGHMFVKGSKSNALLRCANLVYKSVQGCAEAWENISGGYVQGDAIIFSKTSKTAKNQVAGLQSMIFNRAVSALRSRNVPVTKKLTLQHCKYLIAAPGSGPQSVHLDGYEKDSYVVALYLSEGRATEFAIEPAYCGVDVKLDKLSTKDCLEFYNVPWPQNSSQFTSQIVSPGDMMIFHKDVLHRGPFHDGEVDRVVLFAVLAPNDVTDNDEFQEFEWSWMCFEYGLTSKEHIESVKRHAAFDPLHHYSVDERREFNENLQQKYRCQKNKKINV